MKNNNINITSSSEQDPPRPRPDVALVEPEQATAAQEQNSVVQDEGRPSTGVENSTPLQGQETAGMGTSDQQVNSPSNTSEPLDDDAPQTQNNDAETGSSESVTAQYVVCKGATCKCDGNPAAKATLEVTTHKKYYVNDDGNDKLIATIADITFREGVTPFITCSHKKGYDKTCTYAPMGKWEVPNNSRFPEVGGKNILTEKGKLECIIGGKIDFLTHGQTVTVDSEDIQEVEEAFVDMSQINSLVSYDQIAEEEQKYPEEYVNDVSNLERVINEDAIIEAQSEGNTRAFYVLKDQLVEFKATVTVNRRGEEKNRGDNVSWGLTEILEEGVFTDAKNAISNTYKLKVSDQHKVSYRESKRATNQFGFVFIKTGKYIIDAASIQKVTGVEWSYYQNLYCYIEVLDKVSILDLSVGRASQDILVGDELKITLKSDLTLGVDELYHLTIEVVSVPTEGEETTLYIYRDSSIESVEGSMRYTQAKNRITATLECVNSGNFKIRVIQDGQELSELTKEIEVLQNKVVGIEGFEARIRKGEKMSFKAKLQNNENVDSSKVKWKIITPSGQEYGEEKVGTTSEFEFKEIGKYIIQCTYGNSLFSSNKTVKEPIEVIENKLESVSVKNALVKEEGKNYIVYVNNSVTLHVRTLLNYIFEPITSVFTSGFMSFYSTKEEALARIANRKSRKDPLLLYSISFIGKGDEQTQGAIKIDNSTNHKVIDSTPIYFTTSKSVVEFTLVNEGMYFLSVQLGNHTALDIVLDCVKGAIKTWAFIEDSENKKSRLGFYQDFKVQLEVEGAANKTAKIHFWEGRKSLDLFKYDEFYSQEIKFNEQGKFEIAFKGKGSDFWNNFRESISILNMSLTGKRGVYFTITELDTLIEDIDEKIYKLKNAKHIFPKTINNDESVAEVNDKVIYEGFFADDKGRKEIRITEYGKKVPIILKLYNGFHEIANTEDYSLELYENRKEQDRLVKTLDLPKQSNSALIRLELDTSEPEYYKGSHERDMKSLRNPRMFYFILRKQGTNLNKVVYIYPFNYGTGKANDGILGILFQEELDIKPASSYTSAETIEMNLLSIELVNLQIKLKYINLDDLRNSGEYSRTKEKYLKTWDKFIALTNKKVNLTEKEKQAIRKKNDALLTKAGNKYLEQLKLALHAPFNAIIDRKVPIKVESGEAISSNVTKVCVCKEYDLVFGEKVSCQFRQKIVDICKELWGDERKIEMANGLMTVMNAETARTFSSSVIDLMPTGEYHKNGNPKKTYRGLTKQEVLKLDKNFGGAVGLIQFTPTALKALNQQYSLNLTSITMALMDEIEQLDYVKKYFQLQKLYLKLKKPEEIYIQVFAPVGVGKGEDYVLYSKEDDLKKNKNYYKNNSGIDTEDGNSDGKIQIKEVNNRFFKSLKEGEPLKYKGICENDSQRDYIDNEGRAPWMAVAIKEGQIAGGKHEKLIDDIVRKYHTYANFDGNGYQKSWCTSFISWCLGQVKVDNVRTPASRYYRIVVNERPKTEIATSYIELGEKFKEIDEPIYGAIAVWADYKEENPIGAGHIGFIFGQAKKDEGTKRYLILGGNQSDKICVVPMDCSGEIIKKRKFVNFLIPINYIIKESDKLNQNDIYNSSIEANKIVTTTSLLTTGNEST